MISNKDIDIANEYAEEWAENSVYFDKNDHYKWMAEQLGSANVVLEIGCGAGYSTYTLAQKIDRKILVIEVNKALIDKASNYLLNKNILIEIAHSYEDAVKKLDNVQVVFLHLDLFEIENSLQILNQKFDALVCWLIGSDLLNISKRLNKNLENFEKSDFSIYRINLHEFCYKLGESVLRKDGICHMVDRIKIKSWNFKNLARETFVEAHRKLATESYIITLSNTYFRKSGDFNKHRMNYVLSENLNPNGGLNILSSIKSIKA